MTFKDLDMNSLSRRYRKRSKLKIRRFQKEISDFVEDKCHKVKTEVSRSPASQQLKRLNQFRIGRG